MPREPDSVGTRERSADRCAEAIDSSHPVMNQFDSKLDVVTGPQVAPRAALPGLARRPAVVLLHASGSSSRQWDALAERQRPAFDVHAIDLYGHGTQDPWSGPRRVSVHDEAALALPAIERAGGAHLIGHSYGAAVAMRLAAACPSLVRSLAVYEPVVFSVLAQCEPHGAATWCSHMGGLERGCRTEDDAGRRPSRTRGRTLHRLLVRRRCVWPVGPKRQSPIVQRMPCRRSDAAACGTAVSVSTRRDANE
jgi:pimeloyl-ACP methyl ester carboxylesterase